MPRALFSLSVWLIACAGLFAPAAAQTPAAAPLVAPCRKPELKDRVSVTKEDLADLAERANAYLDCMRPWLQQRSADAERLLAEARANAEANNSGVAEVNAFIKAVRDYQLKHKDDQ